MDSDKTLQGNVHVRFYWNRQQLRNNNNAVDIRFN